MSRAPGSRLGLLLGASLALLFAGIGAWLSGAQDAARLTWSAATLLGVGPAAWWVWTSIRQRRLGVDVIALLALVGSLAVGEQLAGAIITVMLATGRVLEARATVRARRELDELRRRAPSHAHRIEGGALVTVPLDAVTPGDVLVVAARRDRSRRRTRRARRRRRRRVDTDRRTNPSGASTR